MANKILFGKTPFSDLHTILELDSEDTLNKKRPRLFPLGNTENEVPTTSIFLASLCAVKEFREELLKEIGISKITNYNVELHTFTELENKTNGDRPDGLIVLTTGKNPIIEWACFVESKVSTHIVEDIQVEKYSDFARSIGINDIITISNVLVSSPLQSPNKIKKNKFNLYHWSWIYLSVQANRLVRNKMISDVDHIYILKELRRYLSDHKNVCHFNDMGKEWKDLVAKFQHYAENQKKDPKVIESLSKSYAQEEKDISLHLTDESEFHVELMIKENHIKTLETQLNDNNLFRSTFFVNKDKKDSFDIEINLIRKEIKCSTMVTISKGKAQAQITNLIKMFESKAGTTDKIIVEAYYIRNKKVDEIVYLSQLLYEKDNNKPYSIMNKEFGDEIKYFELKTIDAIGKDILHNKKIIVQLEEIATRFLNQVISNRKSI